MHGTNRGCAEPGRRSWLRPQTDPNIFPTPDTAHQPAPGRAGSRSAPKAASCPPRWWSPTSRSPGSSIRPASTVGNVDQHSLLLAPAERADVIVDFSQFAGQTLILYNDAPAAFPARVASYDYYTGGPDLSPAGAPTTLPGYGPNTRTIMQVKIAAHRTGSRLQSDGAPARLQAPRRWSGVFESGQNPIIVGQAAYNSAYGTSFRFGSLVQSPSNPTAKCDGFARISSRAAIRSSSTPWLAHRSASRSSLKPSTTRRTRRTSSPTAACRATSASRPFRHTPNGAERRSVPVREPADGAVRRHQPADERHDHPDLGGDRRDTDLEDSPTTAWIRTRSTSICMTCSCLNRVTWDNIIIPPDADRTWLEGYSAGQPAGRHLLRHPAGHPRSCRGRSRTASGR